MVTEFFAIARTKKTSRAMPELFLLEKVLFGSWNGSTENLEMTFFGYLIKSVALNFRVCGCYF